jgi:hypothetical protein
MHTLSRSVAVNASGDDPILTGEQVYRGLMIKQHNALGFVPGMSHCEVTERTSDGIVREIVYLGEPYTERFVFDPDNLRTVCHRLEGRTRGSIVNEIIELDGELHLRFEFVLETDGFSEGTAEEAQHFAEMEESYLIAVRSTIELIREKAREGSLDELADRALSSPVGTVV